MSISVEGIEYTENVTYWGPDTVNASNVTIVYKPSKWENLDVIKSVSWNGVEVTNYTKHATNGIIYDPTLPYGTTHYLTVVYTIPETGKGATGAGRKPPLAVPPIITLPAEFWLWMLIGSLVILVLIVTMLAFVWGG